MTSRLRHRLYLQLEPDARPGLSRLNAVICAAIVVAVSLAVLETEPAVRDLAPAAFFAAETAFGALFVVEYLARLWVAPEDARYAGRLGRLRYALTPAALLDLAAVAPFFLVLGAADPFVLRMVRLLRILRLARLGRFSTAMSRVVEAVHARRWELSLSVVAAGMLLLFSATALYVVEGDDQPEAFGSIPRAMWWSVATLTTVGYGDVYPVSLLGRVLAGVTAITGIGLIAMPAGILAAAFSDVLQKHRDEDEGA